MLGICFGTHLVSLRIRANCTIYLPIAKERSSILVVQKLLLNGLSITPHNFEHQQQPVANTPAFGDCPAVGVYDDFMEPRNGFLPMIFPCSIHLSYLQETNISHPRQLWRVRLVVGHSLEDAGIFIFIYIYLFICSINLVRVGKDTIPYIWSSSKSNPPTCKTLHFRSILPLEILKSQGLSQAKLNISQL